MDDVRLKINKVRRVVDVYRCIYLHGVRYAVNADIPRGQEVVLTLLDGKVLVWKILVSLFRSSSVVCCHRRTECLQQQKKCG